jgi:hypothetical protein
MGMQTDVLSGHIHQSGYVVQQTRSRIKGISVRGSASAASELALFSTETAPVAATYAQANATVTITKSSHGLANGQSIGISYSPGTGGAATSGNYAVTVVNSAAFTVVSPNPNNVTAGAVCTYVAGGEWLLTLDLVAGDTFQNYFLLPGEGILCKQQCYASMTNVSTVTVFYG